MGGIFRLRHGYVCRESLRSPVLLSSFHAGSIPISICLMDRSRVEHRLGGRHARCRWASMHSDRKSLESTSSGEMHWHTYTLPGQWSSQFGCQYHDLDPSVTLALATTNEDDSKTADHRSLSLWVFVSNFRCSCAKQSGF